MKTKGKKLKLKKTGGSLNRVIFTSDDSTYTPPIGVMILMATERFLQLQFHSQPWLQLVKHSVN